jgi:hypothetical protein
MTCKTAQLKHSLLQFGELTPSCGSYSDRRRGKCVYMCSLVCVYRDNIVCNFEQCLHIVPRMDVVIGILQDRTENSIDFREILNVAEPGLMLLKEKDFRPQSIQGCAVTILLLVSVS